MSELDPVARALVAASRGAEEPSDEALSRVERSLLAKIAAGTGAVVGLTATTKAAGSAFALKVASGVLAIGLAAGGVLLATRQAAPPAPAQVAPAAEPVVVPPAAEVEPAPPVEPAPAASPAVEPSKPSVSAKPESPALKLKAEAALVGDAQRALGAGRAGEALEKLGQYEQRFPSGALRSEAEATRVFALCQGGRLKEAEAAKAAFLRRYPTSPAAPRVRSACAH